MDLSEMKLLVTTRALRVRREFPEAFGAQGSYRTLHAGPHFVGHVRGERVAALALRAPHGVSATTMAGERIEIGAGRWVDELTSRVLDVGEAGLAMTEAFVDAPVALLVSRSPE